MPAALSWIDYTQLDLDGLVSLGTSSGGAGTLVNDPAYPGRNAWDNDPSLVGRWDYERSATGGVSMELQSVWGVDLNCRVVAAINCKLPADLISAHFAVRNFTSGVIESTLATPYTPANLVPIPGTTDRYNLYGLLSVDRSVQRLDLVLNLPPSTSGVIEVGRFWCGPALVLSSTDSGWSSSTHDPSQVDRGRGGALIAERLPALDGIDWPLGVLSYEQAYGDPGNAAAPSIRRMRTEAGIGSPIVGLQRSDNMHSLQVLSTYAALTQLPEIRHLKGDLYATQIRAQQIR